MSSRCLLSELRGAAEDRGLDDEEKRRVVDLCLAIDGGWDRGERYGYPGEPGPPPETPGEPAGKALPPEAYLSAERLAVDALEFIDDLRPDGSGPLLPELDPFGRLGLVELLAKIGLKASAVLPARQMNAITQRLCWRDVALVPKDWEDVLLPLVAQNALLNLVNPAALAAAHGKEGGC